MSDIKWTVSSEPKEKIEYVQTTTARNDSEKESVRLWNLMRKTLLDNGLMKEKGED